MVMKVIAWRNVVFLLVMLALIAFTLFFVNKAVKTRTTFASPEVKLRTALRQIESPREEERLDGARKLAILGKEKLASAGKLEEVIEIALQRFQHNASPDETLSMLSLLRILGEEPAVSEEVLRSLDKFREERGIDVPEVSGQENGGKEIIRTSPPQRM